MVHDPLLVADVSTRREVKDARYKLTAGIKRAEKLRHRSLEQLCDGDLPMVDREQAQDRFRQADSVIVDLSGSLVDVEDWLKADSQIKAAETST